MAQQERQLALTQWAATQMAPLQDKKLLEVGCGTGGNLLRFIILGFQPENLTGSELLPELVARAEERLPSAVRIISGDSSELDLPPSSFDVVFQSLVFSSILDDAFQERLAQRMWGLVSPGGGVLWYDFTVDNPRNPDVRGVSINRIRELFPTSKPRVRRMTLAPPVSRFVTRLHPSMYTLCNLVRPLRTHVLVWMRKESA
jgi:SAM-dependent methyltransferase